MANETVKPLVASSKPVGQMSKEERARRYKELRERMGASRLKVVGKPGIHYFWGPHEDSGEMARLDMIGYSIVREPNAEQVLEGKVDPQIKAAGLRQDGTYVIGDVMLMQCPEELYEMILLDSEQRHQEMVQGAVTDFLVSAEQNGAPVIEVNKR